jgi:hypothetical protein
MNIFLKIFLKQNLEKAIVVQDGRERLDLAGRFWELVLFGLPHWGLCN